MPFIGKVPVLCKTRLIFPRINGPNVEIKAELKMLDGVRSPMHIALIVANPLLTHNHLFFLARLFTKISPV